MTKVLVVDDAKTDRVLVEAILQEGDLDVETAASGAEALEKIRHVAPHLVVTDLMMPEMDGLELVARLHREHRGVPSVLMTSRGSEEIAVAALKAGASSYVPKRLLQSDLMRTVRDVLALSRDRFAEQALFSTMQRSEYEFHIGSDLRYLRPLARHLQTAAARMGLCDETERTQIAMALHEALQNAVEHGNLELNSDRRDASASYDGLIDQRRAAEPYRDRHVHVAASMSRDHARFTVRDEGPGFDHKALPDALEPENLEKLSGRGILLMRTFMDEVTYNDRGNEVTMIKRRPA